jgi:hypothetical protein
MLRFSVRIFSLFGVALLLASLSYAQQPTSPPATRAEALTNSDVLKMVEAKLTDDLIIGKIKSSPSDFDTSIDAILKLKAAGASDAIIHAMVEARPTAKAVVKEAVAKEPAPDPNDPKSPHASGLYWKPTSGPDKRVVKLEASTYSQGKAGPGFFKMTWKIVIKGDRAALRITEPAPEFWFYFATGGEAFASSGPSNPDDFVLARLEKKSKERELAVGQGGMTGMKAGVRSQDTIALESKQVAPGIYQARASRPLEPGEYAFVRAGVTMESASSGKLFDFGIERAK